MTAVRAPARRLRDSACESRARLRHSCWQAEAAPWRALASGCAGSGPRPCRTRARDRRPVHGGRGSRLARRLRPAGVRRLAGLGSAVGADPWGLASTIYTVALHVRHRLQPPRGRLRQELDFPELEERTKIRPKYLRALEDERFDILPARPTCAASSARTPSLGLDGQPFVDEYNTRFAVGDEDARFELAAYRLHAGIARDASRGSRCSRCSRSRSPPRSMIAAWKFGEAGG